MHIDGIYNVRDVGGYMTASGVRTRQGLVYRGSILDNCAAGVYDTTLRLSDDGVHTFTDVLGIRHDLDIRETKYGQYYASIGAHPMGEDLLYSNFQCGAYGGVFSQSSTGITALGRALRMLADENNYPLYFHCSGGADRTGTMSFVLNALCGVSYEDCIIDYEYTTFSSVGLRSKNGIVTAGTPGISEDSSFEIFMQHWNELSPVEQYPTLQAQAEHYCLYIGLTQEEIAKIQGIMLGEIAVPNH